MVFGAALALAFAACAAGRPSRPAIRQPSVAVSAPQSIGRPNGGSLNGGTRITSFDGALVVNPDRCWATDEAAALLKVAIQETLKMFPDAHDLVVGDFSKAGGGPLSPHRSHQSGRDVDVGFYHVGTTPKRSFLAATDSNLDVEKTWYFVESLLLSERVQYIFVDEDVQRLLYDHARQVYAPRRLETWFQYPRGRQFRGGIIRHVAGHRDHLHIRFVCPLGDRECIP